MPPKGSLLRDLAEVVLTAVLLFALFLAFIGAMWIAGVWS